MNDSRRISPKRFDSLLEALRKGEQDAQLLSGRNFNANYWRNARRQLTNLRRDLDRLERENAAYRVVLGGDE